jgi:hypothetical protein
VACFQEDRDSTAVRRALRERQASHGAPAVGSCRNPKTKRRRRRTQREQRREHGNQNSINSGGGARLERRLREQQTRPSGGAISSGERSQTAAPVKRNRANEETQQRTRHIGCGGAVASGGSFGSSNPSTISRMESGLGLRAREESNKPNGFSARNRNEATRFATRINTENKILRSKTRRLRTKQTQIFQQKSNKILTPRRSPPSLPLLIGTKT